MDAKTALNSIFGVKNKTLEEMTNEVGRRFDTKEDIFIDFGEGAEEIDSVMRDGYNKKVIYSTLDIILELNKNRNTIYYVSGIQMKYSDSARVPIIKGAIFRFYDEHGNLKVFHSTPETKLRVIKLGDETQLHLEHARKMKFD